MEVGPQVGVVPLRLARPLHLVVQAVDKIREQGRMALGSQELNHDAVSHIQRAVKRCGLNKVQVTTQLPLFITIRNANEYHCQMYRLKVSSLIRLLTATFCDI